MTLTVAPASGANSYASLAATDAYHAVRANATWTGTDEAKESALIRATQWLDGRYRSRWPGLRTGGRSQALEWPRSGVVDMEGNGITEDEVPVEVVNATMEAALRELVAPGSLAPDYVANTGVKRERVGPLEVEYLGVSGASSVQPVLTAVDEILASLIGPSSGVVGRLVRA
jgi:hypothetical protein